MKLYKADRFFSRTRGLLGRPRLLANEGLWLHPCRSVHTFGMRYPIDVVFIDRQSRVVKCIKSMGPGQIAACSKAYSVIELAAETVEGEGISPGMWLQEAESDEYEFAH